MAIFNSYVSHYQRVFPIDTAMLFWRRSGAPERLLFPGGVTHLCELQCLGKIHGETAGTERYTRHMFASSGPPMMIIMFPLQMPWKITCCHSESTTSTLRYCGGLGCPWCSGFAPWQGVGVTTHQFTQEKEALPEKPRNLMTDVHQPLKSDPISNDHITIHHIIINRSWSQIPKNSSPNLQRAKTIQNHPKPM